MADDQLTQTTAMAGAQWRPLIVLSVIYAVRMLGLFMLLPIMALYVAGLRAATPVLIGLAIGAYGLTQALLQIPFGALSDRLGRRPVITVGLVLFALGSLWAAFASSVYGVIAGRALQGAGAVAAVVMALAADLTPDAHRSKTMAMLGGSIGVAFVIALIAGPALYARLGGAGMFGLIALMAVLSIALLWLAVPVPAMRERPVLSRSLLSVAFDRSLLIFNAGIFCLHAVLTAVFIAVPLMLVQRFAIPVEWHWLVYLVVMLLSLLLMLPALVIAERAGKGGKLLLAAAAGMPLALLLLFLQSGHLPLFFAGLLLFFVFFNALEALLPSLVSRSVPSSSRGAALGVYSTCQFSGAFVGGVAGGLVIQQFGLPAAFAFGSILSGFWLIIAALLTAVPGREADSAAVDSSG